MTELARTPLYEWHTENRGRMVDFAGWAMPVQYESIVIEHNATRNEVGLFDISHMGRFRFESPDVASFLDRLLTRAILPMKPGAIRYGLAANEEGGVRDDVLAYRLSDENGEFFLLVVNAGNREKIFAWIEEQKQQDEQFTLTDMTSDSTMIAVQGPRAVELGDQLCEPKVSSLGYYQGVCGAFGSTKQAAMISRTGYTGEDGFELIVDNRDGLAAWLELFNAGEPLGARAVGLGARDTLRLEAAMPLYGHELGEDISPLEAGLRFAIQLKEREFVGSTAIRSELELGVSRKRIGLTLDGRRAPREGYLVLNESGAEVGVVTSGTFSPTLGHPVAMAYVDAEAAGQTDFQVDIRGRLTPAKAVKLPFYSRGETG